MNTLFNYLITICLITICLIILLISLKKKYENFNIKQKLIRNNLNNKFFNNNKLENKICICILCIFPNKIWIDFLLKIKNEYNNYDIYLCIDDNSKEYKIKDINIIQLDENKCKKLGFYNISYFKKKVVSWDKAICYFCHFNKYKYYWFIEDDVFIPTKHTLANIDAKYSYSNLLVKSHMSKDKTENWPHWYKLKDSKHGFDLPWFRSMVCSIRISNKFITSIFNFVKKKKKLYFLEFFFNTLADKENLSVKYIAELNNINHEKKFKDTELSNKNLLYHPVKNLDEHVRLRNKFNFN